MKVSGNVFDLTVTQANLAKALGLTSARVNQLIDLEIVIRDEKDPSGGVFLVKSINNYWASKKASAEDANLWIEKGKHEKVKRELAELKLAKEQGRLYEASTVEHVMIEQLVGLRTHLLGLAIKLAPQLENRSKTEVYDILNREIEEKLSELSSYEPKLFSSGD